MQLTWTLKMITWQVVKTSVTVNYSPLPHVMEFKYSPGFWIPHGGFRIPAIGF